MTVAKVVPNPRDRTSKDRQRTTVRADHKGKYRAWWTIDFNEAERMALYDRFRQGYQ